MRKIGKFQIDYSWIMLFMGTLAVFGALGLARYGYTMLLPAMQLDLGMDNRQAGLLAAFNLGGYLTFAMVGGVLASRFGTRLVAALGLLFAGSGMIFTGLAGSFFSVALWRTITGLGSGAANVAIMSLWSAWFSHNKRGLASGIAVSGSSMGLIFTGLLVPFFITGYGDPAWRISWFIFGGIAVALAVTSYCVLRDRPHGSNLSGWEEQKIITSASFGLPGIWKLVYLSPRVWSFGLVYSAFGFSYIIYMTFFVKFLTGDFGYTTAGAGNLFMIMGWLSLLCGIIWGSVSDSMGRKNTLIILFSIHAVAFGLFGLGRSPVLFALSAVLYGFTAWSIPAIMAAVCGDMLGPRLAPAALGFITLFFGIGQALGPVVGGILADMTGSFSSAFLLASATAFLGAVSSRLLLRDSHINATVLPPAVNITLKGD